MNIFEEYLKKITALILKKQKFLKLDNVNNFKGISVETPPPEFNFDLSCNASLVLGKINKLDPKELANKIKDLILKNLQDFEKVEIAGPGFLNLKLTNKFLISNINKIIENKEYYGKKNSNNIYNIEFVSANPTGPMHVGHCRGAIYGDVLANLLKFNGNKVTKEYYINDYGNQIKNFAKSVFLRIREIKYNEKFILKEDLYAGEYIIQIAKKISEWPKCLEISTTKLEPHRITFYLYELVTLFHSYWNMGKDNHELRFISENRSFIPSRLVLLQALAIVIRNGMSILGVSTPTRM